MTRNDDGSVLIEAMVSAAIVALMLAVLYRSMADSTAREALLTQKRAALLIAQSELDAVGTVLPLAPGSTSGGEDGYVWRVDIEPHAASQGSGSAGNLWNVTVTVRSDRSDVSLVTLRTLALGPGS